MWKFIIILIVLILGKFFYDTMKQSREVRKQGGVRTKYAKLIQMILDSDPRVRIVQETNTMVNVGISGMAGSQNYLLQQTFGKLNVQVVIRNNPLLGNMKIERIFPEDMDQEKMMEELLKAQQEELEKRMNHL